MGKRFGCLTALLLVVAACVWLWRSHQHEVRLDSNFDRITRGMSDAQVIALLGKPEWRGRCGTSDYYSFIEPIKGSADCLVYASAIAPLYPWYPVVFLGPDNRVVDKYTYASP